MDIKRMGVKKTTISANHASREFLHKLNELRWNKTLVDVVITGDCEEGTTDKGDTSKSSSNCKEREILVAADLLLMDRLREAICKFIQTIISAANCVFISKLADVYSCRCASGNFSCPIILY